MRRRSFAPREVEEEPVQTQLSGSARIGQVILILAAVVLLLNSGASVLLAGVQLQLWTLACRGSLLLVELAFIMMALGGNSTARNLVGAWLLLGALATGCAWLVFQPGVLPKIPATTAKLLPLLSLIAGVTTLVYGGLGLALFTPMVSTYLEEC
jgi:hypothetical protein